MPEKKPKKKRFEPQITRMSTDEEWGWRDRRSGASPQSAIQSLRSQASKRREALPGRLHDKFQAAREARRRKTVPEKPKNLSTERGL
jgi:hypothetical protein